MKKQRGMVEIILGIILIIIIAIPLMILDSMSCHSRWKDSGVLGISWGPLQGCKIKLPDGRWMPDSNVREDSFNKPVSKDNPVKDEAK